MTYQGAAGGAKDGGAKHQRRARGLTELTALFAALLRRCLAPLLLLLALTLLWGPLLLMAVQIVERLAHKPALLAHALPLDPVRATLFKNTVQLGILTTIGALVLGVPCAVALVRGGRITRLVVALGCALPLALPPIVPASLAVPLTFAPGRDSPLYPPVLLAAPVLAASFYPLVAFALAAALRALPAEAEDAARLCGGDLSVWRGVLFPLLRPALSGAAGLVFAFSLWEMGAPDLLNLPTYAVQIYRDWNGGVLTEDATLAALDAFPLAVLGAVALWFALRALRFYEKLRASDAAHRHPGARRAAQGARSGVVTALSALAWLVVAVSPGVIIVWLAHVAGGLRGASAAWNEVTQFAGEELFTTLQWAPLGALLALAWAFCLVAPRRLGQLVPRKRGLTLAGWWRWGLLLPMLCPPVTLGLAMATFWNFPLTASQPNAPAYALQDTVGYALGSGGMTLVGYVTRFLPAAAWLLGEATARVPRENLEAAQSLGADEGFAARTILLPLLLPALAGAGAVLGALCVGELTVTVLVAQAGGQPLTIPLFNFMHAGEADLVAALSLALFAAGALLMAGFALLFAACEAVRHRLARRSY